MSFKIYYTIDLFPIIQRQLNRWYVLLTNCFKKAGFDQYSEWVEDDIPLVFLSNADESQNETSLVNSEKKNNCNNSFQDYIEVDNEL